MGKRRAVLATTVTLMNPQTNDSHEQILFNDTVTKSRINIFDEQFFSE